MCKAPDTERGLHNGNSQMNMVALRVQRALIIGVLRRWAKWVLQFFHRCPEGRKMATVVLGVDSLVRSQSRSAALRQHHSFQRGPLLFLSK